MVSWMKWLPMGDHSPSYTGAKTFQMLLVSILIESCTTTTGTADICSWVEDTGGSRLLLAQKPAGRHPRLASLHSFRSGPSTEAEEYQGPTLHRRVGAAASLRLNGVQLDTPSTLSP